MRWLQWTGKDWKMWTKSIWTAPVHCMAAASIDLPLRWVPVPHPVTHGDGKVSVLSELRNRCCALLRQPGRGPEYHCALKDQTYISVQFGLHWIELSHSLHNIHSKNLQMKVLLTTQDWSGTEHGKNCGSSDKPVGLQSLNNGFLEMSSTVSAPASSVQLKSVEETQLSPFGF